MPTLSCFGETYSCARAQKGTDYVRLLDADGNSVFFADEITDFSDYVLTGGSWETPLAVVAPTVGATATLANGVITLTIPKAVKVETGLQINFAAPCDCSAVTGLSVCGMTFDVVDAMSRTVIGIGGYFTEGAVVSVILDIEKKFAYLQNAASGAFKVGDTLTTLRTDLDDSWLLCNGEAFDAANYPRLAEICAPNTPPFAAPYSTGYGFSALPYDMKIFKGKCYLTAGAGRYLYRSDSVDGEFSLIKSFSSSKYLAIGVNDTHIVLARGGGSSGSYADLYVSYSEDGETWSDEILVAAGGTGDRFAHVVYGGGKWLIFGAGYSTDSHITIYGADESDLSSWSLLYSSSAYNYGYAPFGGNYVAFNGVDTFATAYQNNSRAYVLYYNVNTGATKSLTLGSCYALSGKPMIIWDGARFVIPCPVSSVSTDIYLYFTDLSTTTSYTISTGSTQGANDYPSINFVNGYYYISGDYYGLYARTTTAFEDGTFSSFADNTATIPGGNMFIQYDENEALYFYVDSSSTTRFIFYLSLNVTPVISRGSAYTYIKAKE